MTRIIIHELLRHLSGIEFGQQVFEAGSSTSLECLDAAIQRFPSLKQWTYQKDGRLSPQVWFFVNGERLLDNQTTRSLQDGDEVLIFFNHL